MVPSPLCGTVRLELFHCVYLVRYGNRGATRGIADFPGDFEQALRIYCRVRTYCYARKDC